MNATRTLQAAQRTPLIKFLGKRSPPKSVDHTPAPHPASPTQSLPESFAQYRSKAQQHGPLGGGRSSSSSASSAGGIGAMSGHDLGNIQPPQGTFFDRSELPERFQRLAWSLQDIEAVESGGASTVA